MLLIVIKNLLHILQAYASKKAAEAILINGIPKAFIENKQKAGLSGTYNLSRVANAKIQSPSGTFHSAFPNDPRSWKSAGILAPLLPISLPFSSTCDVQRRGFVSYSPLKRRRLIYFLCNLSQQRRRSQSFTCCVIDHLTLCMGHQ